MYSRTPYPNAVDLMNFSHSNTRYNSNTRAAHNMPEHQQQQQHSRSEYNFQPKSQVSSLSVNRSAERGGGASYSNIEKQKENRSTV